MFTERNTGTAKTEQGEGIYVLYDRIYKTTKVVTLHSLEINLPLSKYK